MVVYMTLEHRILEFFEDRIERGLLKYDTHSQIQLVCTGSCSECDYSKLTIGIPCYDPRDKYLKHIKDNHLHPELFI